MGGCCGDGKESVSHGTTPCPVQFRVICLMADYCRLSSEVS